MASRIVVYFVKRKKLWGIPYEGELQEALGYAGWTGNEQRQLRKLAGISPATFTKLRRNQEVALSVLLKIADVLDCDVGDMMSFVKDDAQVLPKEE